MGKKTSFFQQPSSHADAASCQITIHKLKQTNHREAFQTVIMTVFPSQQGRSERAMHCIVRYCSACRLFTCSVRAPTIDGPIDPQPFLLASPGQLCINGSSGGNEVSSFAPFLPPALWPEAYFSSPLPLPSCPVHTSLFNVCAPTVSASARAFCMRESGSFCPSRRGNTSV